jgi:2-methylcitrate dehydratase PrpD
MTLTVELAARARAPISLAATERLRALTLTNMAAGLGDPGRARRLLDSAPFDGGKSGDAAFLFAMRLHARTQDDFYPYGRVHVGVLTLGATLALADRSGDRLLESLAAGYEVMCAAATAYARDAQRRGYRPSGVFGPVGAAASAAVALGLDEEGVANAIGLAAARAGGTMQSWNAGTDEWLLEVGAASRAGVEAALFTEAGAVAAPDALEGQAGWARAYFDDPDPTRLRDAIARESSYVLEVAAKPYPVSGIAQVPTDLGARAHADLNGHEVRSVVVRLSEPESAYPGSASLGPFRSRSDALMSVGFCVVCALADGTVRLDRLERPNDFATAMKRVRVEPDSSLDEGEAVLVLEVDGETREYSGKGHSILYPSWASLAPSGNTVAARSEADPAYVARAFETLEAERPDAQRLAELLGAAE